MADKLAVQMATAAKAKRDALSAADKLKVETQINQLATFAWAEANAGRSYLQIVEANATHKPFYEAVISRQGIIYLEGLGFHVELMQGVANIWWEERDTIFKEAQAQLNPQPAPDVV